MYHLSKALYLYFTRKEEYSILLLGLDNAGKTTLLNQIKSLYLPPSSSATTLIGGHSSSSSPAQTVPTVGQNVTVLSLPDMYLKLWDVGGQQSLRKLWNSYYDSCHAIIFVVDSTDVGDATLPASFTGSLSTSDLVAAATTPSAEDAASITGPTSSTTAATPSVSTATATATATATVAAPDTAHTGRLHECAAVLNSILTHTSTRGIPILVLANKQDAEDCVEVVRIKEGLVRRVFEGDKGAAVRDSRVLPVSALTGTGVREAVEWVCSRVKWNREARPPVMR